MVLVSLQACPPGLSPGHPQESTGCHQRAGCDDTGPRLPPSAVPVRFQRLPPPGGLGNRRSPVFFSLWLCSSCPCRVPPGPVSGGVLNSLSASATGAPAARLRNCRVSYNTTTVLAARNVCFGGPPSRTPGTASALAKYARRPVFLPFFCFAAVMSCRSIPRRRVELCPTVRFGARREQEACGCPVYGGSATGIYSSAATAQGNAANSCGVRGAGRSASV